MSKNAKEIIRANALEKVRNLNREVNLSDIIPIINGSTYSMTTLFNLLFSFNNKIKILDVRQNKDVFAISLDTGKIIIFRTQNNEWKVL